jgi:drug/metabolite transporter (DMT)-like permease
MEGITSALGAECDPNPMNNNAILTGLGIGLLSAVCYGSNVPYAKLAAVVGANGPNLVFYRAFLMVALLGILGLTRGSSLAVPAGTRGVVLGLGIATSVVGICYISSVAFIPVGVATIIYYVYPLVVLVVSPMVDGERLTIVRLVIFAFAFAGLFIAIGPSFTSLDPRGLALAAMGAAGAAAQFFLASRATRVIGPAAAGFWTQFIIIPIAFVACLPSGGVVAPSTLIGAAWPVGMHIGLFALAFGLQMMAARIAPPAALGLVFCVEPVVSIVLATQVLNESLTPPQATGGALVLIAIITSVMAEGRKPAVA